MADLIDVSTTQAGIATLTLNHPERKDALSMELRDQMAEALKRLAVDEALQVLILTGAGSVFCAGFDLNEFERAESDAAFARALWRSSDLFHEVLVHFPLPVIAAVNGPAIAGGFDLALMCDLRIAAEGVWFSHPEIAFGDITYAPLHDLVGGAVARELVLTGRRVEAEEARTLRLVSAVVPAAELHAEAARVAAQITQAPRYFLRRTKAKILQRAGFTALATQDL
ncbi:MAG: enoyl-CoA hydratase/isomerase family protein [Alphaproteobacteria bacterium]